MPRCTLLSIVFSLSAAALWSSVAADDAVATSLRSVLAKNVAHAREWLEQKDFKSVAQSAGGLQLLIDLLKAQSDDGAWQAATGNIASAASSLQKSAAEADSTKCNTALESLDKALAAAAALKPTGKPQPLARAPAIRPLMLAMDAIQADAKVAILTGNIAAAKNQACVLAELARLVSNSRDTEQWSSLAGDFSAAATAAATTSETDPKAVRQVFRNLAEKCDACHEKNRTR